MAGKRGGAGRASPRAAKARRADEPAVAAARRAALDGELDETMALRLFLAGGDRGKCGRTCKGSAKRVDCVCGLVPPVDGFRRTGLWRRDTDALVSEAVGVNPSTLARASRAVPVGLRNLGNTCYVNAAIQCVFAIQSFREEVLALDPGDDPSVAEGADTRGGVSAGADTVSAGAAYAGASHDDACASAPDAQAPSPPKRSDDENNNATAALRLLFASMVAGDRAVADPRRFADALCLETAAQQDGQEFLKLLLAYLDRVAARGLSASAAKDEPEPEPAAAAEPPGRKNHRETPKTTRSDARTFIADHFRGQYTYATTCSRCGCASEASSREVDFYELELNVSDPTKAFFDTDGPASSRDAWKKTETFGLRDALGSFLAVERLEGDNQYQCGFCGILTDATRAVKLRRLPKYLAFQLKRFVFDFETFERRKCADAFEFPGEVNMADFLRRGDAVKKNADDDEAERGPTDESSHSYALRSILLHRGQNATSGHYVALVRAASEPGEDADAVAAEPSRSERKKAISPNPTRNPKPEPGSRTSARDAWWRFDDEEVTALRGGPFGEPAAKGKDGWTLEPGSYASSDAYLLVYERVDEEGTPCEDIGGDGGAAAAGAARGALPADLAAAVSVENDSLAAMVATFASRVEEARERIETRKARARRVAEMAAPPRACWDDDEQPPEDDDAAAPEGDPAAGSAADAFGRDSYRFAPRSWLARFCDDTHDPGPMDLRPILCAHGEVDPSKAEATVRISREAFELLVDAAGAAGGGAAAPGVCRRCLRASAALVAGEDAEVTARAEARDRLEAWEKRVKAETKDNSFVTAMDEQTNAPSGPSKAGAAIVSAAWLKKWRAWRRGPPPPALTREGPTSSITCAHGNLKPSANVSMVDRDTWSFLVRNPPAKEQEPGGSVVEPRVIEIDVDDPGGPGADAPGETAACAGGGGGGGGGGLAVPAHGTASASNANARHLEITSEKGPTARSTAASDPSTGPSVSLGPESSPARWPVHFASAEACAACVSSRLEAAAAKSSSRELAEIHRAACAALRHPLDPDAVDIEVDGGGGGDGNEALQNAKDARFRALPRRWLARWRAFAFAKGIDKHSTGASPAWRPSLESLREAVEELFCPHGGLVAACDLRGSVWRKRSGESREADASLAALEAERTRALRAVFGDGATITSTRKTHTKPNGDGRTHASTLPVADSLEGGVQTGLDGASLRPNANRRGRVLSLELVPASALAALEEVLGGRVHLAPRCFAAPASASDGFGWTFAPATCAACRVSRANANAECRGEEESDGSWLGSSNERPFVEPYFSAAISVRRVKSDPAAFAKAFADRAKAIGAKRRVLDADRLDADADRGGFRREESLAAEKKKDHAPANRDNATTRRGRVVKAPSPVATNKRSETGVGGAACANLPRLDPVGRACSLVVDHDYTAWRVKLMALEKLAIHPLDISLFYVTYRRDFSDDGDGGEVPAIPDAVFELENAKTLREAGVPAGARLALFATATRDPEDLTGLEMPLGPVVWETEGGGGDARVGAVAGASARERGFAGTALTGFGE